MKNLVTTKDTIKLFSASIRDKNLELLSSLLASDGLFELQLPDLSTAESNKLTFVNWIADKLKETKITTVGYDQCLHCKIGNPVVLFNEGTFPRTIKDSSERSKTGLMLEIEEGQINRIKFCFVFVETENKYDFECKSEIIKGYIKNGLSFDEAYKKAIKPHRLE